MSPSALQTATLAVLLAAIFAFFAGPVQHALQGALRRRPALLWAAPLLLTAVFVAASAVVSAVSAAQTLVVLAYTGAPVLCRYRLGPRADFLAILLLWLPIEFAAGVAFVRRASYGFLLTVIDDFALVLFLLLFCGFRPIGGMQFNLPPGWLDLWLPLAGFASVPPVLIAVGVGIGFIPPPHLP